MQPLCVDLDGTLIRSDLLWESFLCLAREKPFRALLTIFRLSAGRAALKRALATSVQLDPATLPYREEVLKYVKEARAQGRKTLLVTASDAVFAEKVAAHCGCFDEVLASDGKENLKGRLKAQKLIARFGEKSFEYVADASPDLHVWKHAASASVVTDSDAFVRQVGAVTHVEKVIPRAAVTQGSRSLLKRSVFLRAARVHQWVKNLLLFVPVVMAHELLDRQALTLAVLAFFAFSLCASGVYVVNDLFDLESDRQHIRKRHRPIASGELSIPKAAFFALLLFLGGFAFAAPLPLKFCAALAFYVCVTMAYSLVLKTLVMVDIITLACLYTLRIHAGGYASSVLVSPWLLIFSIFWFTSLACVKRFSEIASAKEKASDAIARRGYVPGDLDQVAQFGSASGYISVLVMALYVSSRDVTTLYAYPQFLWLICPLLLYWISRVWLLAHRGKLHDDPIVFAITDKVSYLVGAMALVIMWVAS